MKPPGNDKDLQSFPGLVNYLTRYSSQLATITASLRELTKKEIAFVWGREHDQAFKQSKRKYRPWVCWDSSTRRKIQPFRTMHPRRGWELPSHNTDSQYATLQGHLLRLNKITAIYRERHWGQWWGGLEKFHYFVPSTQTTNPLGAIHSTKISGNFGLKLNGSVRSNRKGFQKIIPPFEVDHFCRSKWNVPFDHTDPFSIPGPCCSVSSTYKIRQNGGKYLGVTKQSNEKKIERVKNFTIV